MIDFAGAQYAGFNGRVNRRARVSDAPNRCETGRRSVDHSPGGKAPVEEKFRPSAAHTQRADLAVADRNRFKLKPANKI